MYMLKKPLQVLCLLLIVLSLPVSTQTTAAQQRVTLNQIIGKVEVRSTGSGKWRPARVGMGVRAGWDIRTYVESSAQLSFETGTVISINENTVMTMDELLQKGQGATKSNVKIATGKVFANVQKLVTSKSSFEFETPTAVASIRGTRLSLDVGRSGTAVEVEEGLVAVKKKGSNKQVMVSSNKKAIVTKERDDISVVEMEPKKQSDSTTTTVDTTQRDTTSSDSTRIDSVQVDATQIDLANADTTLIDSANARSQSQDSTVLDSASGKQSVEAQVDSLETDSIATPTYMPGDTTLQGSQSAVDPGVGSSYDQVLQQQQEKEDESTTSYELQPGDADSLAATSLEQAMQGQEDDAKDQLSWMQEKPLQISISSPANKAIVKNSPVLVTGTVNQPAEVQVNGQGVSVAAGGSFSVLIELDMGQNTLEIEALSRGGQKKQMRGSVVLVPPLTLEVPDIVTNMEVSTDVLPLDVEVSEGASYSVNGQLGAQDIALASGVNVIVIRAWDEYGNTTERQFVVKKIDVSTFSLSIASPKDGAVIQQPRIAVSGSTLPGAKVLVNGVPVMVNSGGFFSTRIPIPDEPQEYSVDIEATLGSEQISEQVSVTYEPQVEPLQLIVTSPVDGQEITTRSIRVTGRSSAGATVMVNDKPAIVSPSTGVFSAEVIISEYDIGELMLEVVAYNELEELQKSIAVQILPSSAQINTSIPTVLVQGHGPAATRNGTLYVQALDRTPEDELTLSIELNGSRESIVVEPGSREALALEEGQNEYEIRAADKAGNISNSISGSMYYLPGPLEIDILEPADNPVIIHDLPPLPHNAGQPKIMLEVEIDDGIHTVPETITYCKVTGNATSLIMKNNQDYTFESEITLQRGTNTYVIQVEDVAGNVTTQTLTIVIDSY